MDSTLEQAATKAQALEKQLDQSLNDSTAPLEQVVAFLNGYRVASDDIIAIDFLHARSQDVETRLWSVHSRLNARLRKQLSKLRKANRPVESRKLTKQYLDFLKTSQRFYREHIQKLNARYGGITELERIARQAKLDATTTEIHAPPAPDVQYQVVLSCHQTLIYLGDLFRYRAAERLDKEPDWGPAIGYYDLAAALRPSSGMAYHQQSVIAFEQGDHLRSTYFLYRSIVVEEPHPNAIPNLELQFKKISTGWEKGELVPKSSPQDPTASRKALIAWFIRFHSMSYRGQHFSEYEELEREVLSRTNAELKNRSADGLLLKMCFINFAAQATAASQFRNKPDRKEFMQSFFVFLRFNLKFFSVLLDSYCADLEAISSKRQEEQRPLEDLPAKITDVARHTLPIIRLYSVWLLSNSHIVAARVGDDVLQSIVNRFWKTYAASLSLMASSFPFPQLPEIPYQLEEDVDALEFLPLKSESTKKLWTVEGTNQPRPKWSDQDLQRQDRLTEALARVRGLQYDGLMLAVDNDVPIMFVNSRFVFDGEAVGETTAIPPQQAPQQAPKIAPQPRREMATTEAESGPGVGKTYEKLEPVVETPQQSVPVVENARPKSREAQLSQMVDDLVGPEDDEDENLPPTPPSQAVEPAPTFSESGEFASYGFRSGSVVKGTSPRAIAPIKTPDLRSSNDGWHSNSPLGMSSQRLQSVSSLWNESLPQSSSPRSPYPPAYTGPPRIPSSASIYPASVHSRVNSGASLRSPVLNSHSYASFDPAPPSVPARSDRFASFQGPTAATGQYLMFGAGSSPWSTEPRRSLPNITPPNGQGG